MTGYLSAIWRLRYFWLSLVRNDLRNRYRRSIIGIGWSLVHPIAMTVVLCAVMCPLLSLSVRDFAPSLLVGLTFWGFVNASVMDGCQSFFKGESYLRQQPAPLAIYPLRTVLGAGFHFLLGLGVAVVFVGVVHGFERPLALLSLVPTLALLFVIGWSLATCMGVANVMFQDSQHLIEVVMQIMFYVTPIIWPPRRLLERLHNSNAEWVMNLNPFAVLLDMIRKPILEGQAPPLLSVALGAIIGLAAVGAAALLLRRFEQRMIFYL